VIAVLRSVCPKTGRFVIGGKRVLYDISKPIGGLLRQIKSSCAPYDLRHTFASWALTQYAGQPGDALLKVQRWLGHSDLLTTQIYLHACPRPAKKNILRHLR